MKKTSSLSKWDKKYSLSEEPGNICWVLENFNHLLPQKGKSLDLACGLGSNALFLAKKGLESHAWDNSSVALTKLDAFAEKDSLNVFTLECDVDLQPPKSNSFDVIVVSNFLARQIFPQLISALKPNGLLFYQTFNQNKLAASGPSNPDFLLKPNELLKSLKELELVYYREDGLNGNLKKGLRNCSYFIGKKKL